MRLDHLLSKEYMSLDRGLHDRSDVHSKSTTDEPTIEEPIAHLERMVGDRWQDGVSTPSFARLPQRGSFVLRQAQHDTQVFC